MAFGNFWRGGGRERFAGEHERDGDRERGFGNDWRDDDRNRWREERHGAWDRVGDEHGGREGRYGSSERESGDAYGDRSRGYGSQGYGSQDYGSSRQGYGGGGSGYGSSYGGERWGGGERWTGQSGRRWGSAERQGQDDYPSTRYGSSEYDFRGGSGSGSRGSPAGYGQGAYGGRSYGSGGYGSERSSQSQGMFRGRGPRGYRRSDERIREDVCDCLTDDPQLDASNLEVTVKDCEVTLSGSVNRREDKRRAEDLAEQISGVKDVRNNLRVSNEQSGALGEQNQGQQGQGQQTGQTGQSPRH